MLVKAPDAPGWNPSAAHEIRTAVCEFVADGDTLKTDDGIWIRLLGINAPEIAHPGRRGEAGTAAESYGVEAKAALADAIQGKEILLITPPGAGAKDRYERTLAIVLFEGRNINLLMIERGYAEVFEIGNLGLLDISAFRSAQDQAEAARVNLYSVPPRDRVLRAD